MGSRRLSREIILKALFLHEVSESKSPEETFDLFCKQFSPEEDEEMVLGCDDAAFNEILPFIREVFLGVTSKLEELDRRLSLASDNWRLDRMSRVDRNVMRLALYEMLYRQDIPHKVSINEAVDLGKEYGAEESGAFINGILDRIHHQLQDEEAKGDPA